MTSAITPSIACSICENSTPGFGETEIENCEGSSAGALVAGAGADRERAVDHQRAVEIGVGAAAHQLREHVERRAFTGRGGRGGGHEIIAPQTGLFDARIGQRHGARRGGHRLLRADAMRGIDGCAGMPP